MDLNFDEAKLLYGLGAFLGVVSILYFGHELILDLSPTIKSFILVSATAAFLGLGEYVDNTITRSALYVFSAFSYLSFLTYILAIFSLGNSVTFLILAGSSALFLFLGYFRNERGYKLDREQSKKLLALLGVIVAGAIVFDVIGAQPDYNLQLKDSVEVVEGEEFDLGVLEVRNDFKFSRNLDIPTFNGCVSIPRDRGRQGIYIRPEDDGVISGGASETYKLTEEVRTIPKSNNSISGNYNVVSAECPPKPEEYTIYIEKGERFESQPKED